jgi:hypothetical protein
MSATNTSRMLFGAILVAFALVGAPEMLAFREIDMKQNPQAEAESCLT